MIGAFFLKKKALKNPVVQNYVVLALMSPCFFKVGGPECPGRFLGILDRNPSFLKAQAVTR